jgi:hypothetical protein
MFRVYKCFFDSLQKRELCYFSRGLAPSGGEKNPASPSIFSNLRFEKIEGEAGFFALGTS